MKPSKTIEKKVQEINALIETANNNGLKVTDNKSTWQTEFKYNPLKYTRGSLYIQCAELDLYRALKSGYKVWNVRNERESQEEDIKATLSSIKRMYTTRLNNFNTYGY